MSKCSNENTSVNLTYESALVNFKSLDPFFRCICTLNFQELYNDAGNNIMYV